MKRRLFAFLLALCLILNMASGIAFATEGDGGQTETTTHTHEWGEWVVTPATCKEAGSKVRTCTLSDCGEQETVTIDKLTTHTPGEVDACDKAKDPTHTEDGYTCQHCAVCGAEIFGEVVPAKGHNFVLVEGEDPTCTEDGFEDYKKCLAVIGEDEDGNPIYCNEIDPEHPYKAIPATGHGTLVPVNAADVACQKDWEDGHVVKSVAMKCSVCQEVQLNKVDIEVFHKWENKEGKDATCTAPGYTAYKKCTECGREEGKATIDQLDHVYDVYVEAIAGSCTEDGREAGMACKCGAYDPDNEPVVITAPGHKWTEEIADEVPATCTSTGTTAIVGCSECDAEQGGETIPMKPHAYSSHMGKKATCTEEGYGAYKECDVCGDRRYADPTKAVIPAHGHSNEDGYYPEDGKNNTPCAPRNYLYDGYDMYTIKDTKPEADATCTTEGYVCEKLCTFCGEVLVEAEVIPALGHDWEVAEEGVIPTCTTPGKSDKWECTRCDAVIESQPINVRPHTMKSVPEKLPDCENEGNFAYDYCTVCGYATNADYNEQPTADNYYIDSLYDERIDVKHRVPLYELHGAMKNLGEGDQHPGEFIIAPYACNVDYREPVVAFDATCEENGIKEGATRCLVCNKYYDLDVIPAKGHSPVVNMNGTPATCDAEGYKSFFFCMTCGAACEVEEGVVYTDAVKQQKLNETEIFTRGNPFVYDNIPEEFILPALGHKPAAGKPLAPTCEEAGHDGGEYCTVCLQTVTEPTPIPATGHKAVVTMVGRPATCTEEGMKDFVLCATCGKYAEGVFTNNEDLQAALNACKNPIVGGVLNADNFPAELIIPATGHDAGAVTPAVPATCDTPGYTEGVHCTKCAIDFEPVYDYLTGNGYIDAEDLYEAGWLVVPKLIEAKGHTPIDVTGYDADCDTIGRKTFTVCNTCGKVVFLSKPWTEMDRAEVEKQLSAAEIKVAVPGLYSNENFPAEVFIPALGHDWMKVNSGYTVEPTCTEAGVNGLQKCKVCGTIEAITIPALGHDIVSHEELAPTCKDEGHEAYDECERCGEMFQANGEKIVVWEDIVIAKLPEGQHTNLQHMDANMATCKQNGNTEGSYCDVCGFIGYEETQPDADAWHAHLEALVAAGKLEEEGLEWVDTAVGDGTPGSGMQSVICPDCGYIVAVRLWPEVKLGDVNMDGKVNSIDALMVLQYKAGVIDTLPNMVAADFNQDEAINAKDAMGILNSKIN